MIVGPFYTNRQQNKLPVSNSVLSCLWTLAKQELYKSVAEFSISKSTMSTHLNHFCSLIKTHLSHYIYWPIEGALQTSGFPNTVCAVHGCHIPIVKQHCNHLIAHYNRKQVFSIILTRFCDSEQHFCHVNVGHPGR